MKPAARIHPWAEGLFQIVLTPPIAGFGEFISAWLVRRPRAVMLIDPGPAVTATDLVEALAGLGVTRLDYLCLTHIHIDHAGAVGHLASHFSATPVVCHPKGAPHLVDPEQLWQVSVNTLGETGRAYGRMMPLDPARLADAHQLAMAPFRLLDTPGHSPHHYAIAVDDYLFAGEAGGVCLPMPSGDLYLRPATPPRFFLETSLASIDRLMALRPERVCYGHFGMHGDGLGLLARHREQLLFWNARLAEEMARAEPSDEAAADRWVDRLLNQDPLLGGFHQMAPEVQRRERTFLLNSVRGFMGYLAGRVDRHTGPA